jgi:hypothetical protein
MGLDDRQYIVHVFPMSHQSATNGAKVIKAISVSALGNWLRWLGAEAPLSRGERQTS